MFSSFFSTNGGDDNGARDSGMIKEDSGHGSVESNETTPTNNSSSFSDTVESANLQGKLLVRKGRACGRTALRWKLRYVHLSFAKGGSVAVFDDTPRSIKHVNQQEASQSPRMRRLRQSISTAHIGDSARARDPLAISTVLLYLPSHLSWKALDVEGNFATFAIEIPTDVDDEELHIGEGFSTYDPNGDSSVVTGSSVVTTGDQSVVDDSLLEDAEDDLNDDMKKAKRKGKPVRIYFKCRKGVREKGLWLEAFSKINRFSTQTRHQRGIMTTFANGVRKITQHRARIRTSSSANFAMGVRRLESDLDSSEEGSVGSGQNSSAKLDQFLHGKPLKGNAEKEYKVLPGYAYPHRWMTLKELHEEMMLPSTHFHDLRDPNKSDKEIGTLKVEALQCVGLPRLDRTSETDGVVYMVCGSCAFATDVIPDRLNPMWLRKTQRACIFPIYHGYARLYVAVFDDDGAWASDDLAGRVVLDVARLRHGSTYDVTLPLRMSTHIYHRRKRGAVRLRFSLEWKAEKDVLLSYIPKQIRIIPPQKSKPDYSTTIACADSKCFQNVAITVHGVHMPDHFSFAKVKGCIREINFTRKYVIGGIIHEIKDIRMWVNPTMSAYVFCAWMHCIYANAFSLVPGYVVFFFVLQLMRTYAIYVVERVRQEGFAQPTFEEMLKALVLPRSTTRKSVEPLKMNRRERFRTLRSYSEFDLRMMDEQCHHLKGRNFLKSLGFIPKNDDEANERKVHLEFPMADGNAYPKFTVRECLCQGGEEEEDDDGAEDEGNLTSMADVGISLRSNDSSQGKGFLKSLVPRSKSMEDDSIHGIEDDTLHGTRDDALDGIEDSAYSEVSDFDEKILNNDKLLDSECKTPDGGVMRYDEPIDEDDDPVMSQTVKLNDERPIHDDSNPLHVDAMQLADKLNPVHLMREQDMDWRNPNSSNAKITDELERIRDKMHELTWNNFNDRVYVIKDPANSFYFGETKKRERRRTKHLSRKLDKLLGLKSYSNSNPIVSRLSLFVEPMIMAVYGFLSFFRAGFNIMSWQDPYLTFLLFIFLCVLSIVLFLLPWRTCLFAAGIVLVGPQNLVIRLLRERGVIPPPKRKRHKEEPEEEDQHVFHSHKRTDGILGPKPPPDVDPREINHIVVPYSPFMYQRMYDWPPEQQYATVTLNEDAIPLEPELSVGTNISSLSSSPEAKPTPQAGSRYPRLHRLRNRIKRGTATGTTHREVEELSKLIEVPSDLASDT
eukprot:CAMPEP_0168752120 /NCGR_PEP_ID=MMETSP0724-20121128/18218_1 /TAXON_ID=265536 /ORGANISM="Amphiprora sp., Strain CCMP467" /LENGTH=1229 /DNA_ID=CAMNT_0008800351 /DNA_START=20 /DNA_END=3710 /DNA_ORIENTATION=+